MAKGQMRSNKEVRKPKADKADKTAKSAAPTAGAAKFATPQSAKK